MMKYTARPIGQMAEIALGISLLSACNDSSIADEVVDTASQAIVSTTWESLPGTSFSNPAAVATYNGSSVDVFLFSQSSSYPQGALNHLRSSGSGWSTLAPLVGHFGMQVAAMSCNSEKANVVWPRGSLRPGLGARHASVTNSAWSAVDTPPDVSRPRNMTAIGMGGCSWFSMFYTDNVGNTLKHQRFEAATGTWSGEQILTDDNNRAISDVDTGFAPASLYDGDSIHIFYVRKSDHRIKSRSYPRNGDWLKVSNERCTGHTIDARNGDFTVAWDGTHTAQGDQGTAYLIFERPGTTDIGVAWSTTLMQGSWHTDQSYTLQTGHRCVGQYSAVSYKPGQVDFFCATTGIPATVRHGWFRSFG
jgi:hypothetical protein